MSKYKEEVLKDIRKRLKASDRKKWGMLSNEQKDLIVETYYEIRDTDYKNINYLLKEHAGEKKQFIFLVLGIGMGVFANPISSILVEYFPTESIWDDLLTASFFGLLLVWFVILFMRMSSESLGDENVIERLLEIGRQGPSRQQS